MTTEEEKEEQIKKVLIARAKKHPFKTAWLFAKYAWNGNPDAANEFFPESIDGLMSLEGEAFKDIFKDIFKKYEPTEEERAAAKLKYEKSLESTRALSAKYREDTRLKSLGKD